MRGRITRWAAILALSVTALPAAAVVNPSFDRNYLLQYTNFRHDSTIDGLTQTFITQDTRILDAAVTIATPDNAEPLWTNAYLEIRKGQPGNIAGTDGNVIFRSSQINWATLPIIGQDNGNPLYVIRLTDLGLESLLTVQFNQLYSLTLKDEGSGGRLHWVESAPSGLYSLGGTKTHTRGGEASTWSFQLVADLGFRIAFVPEPGFGVILLIGSMPLLLRRHRKVPMTKSE